LGLFVSGDLDASVILSIGMVLVELSSGSQQHLWQQLLSSSTHIFAVAHEQLQLQPPRAMHLAVDEFLVGSARFLFLAYPLLAYSLTAAPSPPYAGVLLAAAPSPSLRKLDLGFVREVLVDCAMVVDEVLVGTAS
jgi:hypothetical protein